MIMDDSDFQITVSITMLHVKIFLFIKLSVLVLYNSVLELVAFPIFLNTRCLQRMINMFAHNAQYFEVASNTEC